MTTDSQLTANGDASQAADMPAAKCESGPAGESMRAVPGTDSTKGTTKSDTASEATHTWNAKPKDKGGAPLLNLNRLSHAIYSDPGKVAIRVTLGKLGAELIHVERYIYAFRAALENAVMAAHRSIDLRRAAMTAFSR